MTTQQAGYPANPRILARVAREALRAYQKTLGDPVSPHLDEAPGWDLESLLDGVRVALSGASPAEQHDAWRRWHEARGWRPGPVKDAAALTHPNLVPFEELPVEQRRKDVLFGAVCRALAA